MSGYSAPQVAILPVKDGSAGFAVTAWKSAFVYAPNRANAVITASVENGPAVRGVLNPAGVAALATPNTAGTFRAVTVEATPRETSLVFDLTDQAHTDPFDLRS